MPTEDKDKLSPSVEIRSEEFQEILGSIPHWILRRGITLLAAIVLILLIGSAIFRYPDTISTQLTLTGTLPAASVVARQSGRLDQLLVQEGQAVQQGEYLAIIENPAVAKDVIWLKQYLSAFRPEQEEEIALPPADLQLGTMQSLYSSFYITLFNYCDFLSVRYYTQKISMLKERIDEYEEYSNTVIRQQQLTAEQHELQKNEFRRDSLLYVRGVISSEDWETSHKSLLQSRLSLENMQSTLQNTRIQMTQMRESMLETQQQYREVINNYHTDLRTCVSNLFTEIAAWEQSYVFVAPISGQINLTNYWTENQFVQAGESALHILPQEAGELIGKAILPLTRSGKVKSGQRVNIRFHNFPDNEYGVVVGQVRNVALVPSSHTGEHAYMVEVSLPQGLQTTYGETLPYLPEMQAQADIITEDLTVLQRILLPLRRILSEQKR